MNRNQFSPDLRAFCLTMSVAVLVILQCALSGSVVDHGNFETRLSDMRLELSRSLKVYYGGSTREIPLSLVNTIVINPSVMLTYNNELYFGADITLKDGTRIKSLDKDQTEKTQAFICVQQILTGSNNGEHYSAGIENLLRITVR